MAASDTETESSLHTEPSAGDAYRDAYGPFRVADDKEEVHAFRRWWLNNPLNNLWGANKPNQWRVFKKIQAGVDPAEAVKGGANVTLEDITHRGPTREEILADGSFDIQELPSDEAWFGTPDPAVYAAGTNHLNKQQLADEVAKGNVFTLRQLKQHLAQASEEDLEVWHQVLQLQRLREREFVELPDGGRVSVLDLWNYVKNNPELKALADKDPNMVLPKEGMSREDRIRALARYAPWKLCGNERQMVLPPEVAADLSWGLLAGGSWYSRRPTRWLKGLDGVKDFDFGLYVHEEAAQSAMEEGWGGRSPSEVLSDKAFYREAVGLAPSMGMTLLAVASRPLPLDQVTEAWEQRMRQQIDILNPPPAGSSSNSSSSSSQPKILLSTSSSSAASGSASGSGTDTGSSEEESSSSSEPMVQSSKAGPTAAAQQAPLAAAAAAAAPQPSVAPRQAAAQQQPPPPPPPAAAAPPPPRQQPAAAALPSPAAVQQPEQQLPQQRQQQPASAVVSPVREVEPHYESLTELVSLFGRERLASQTQLMDNKGLKLREGSTIIFSAHPTGSLLVQAISPGLVKEQQSYVLGSVHDPLLTHALMSMFLDPDYTLDSDFTTAAGSRLLTVVNGFRTGQQRLQQSGGHSWLHAGAEVQCRALVKHATWALPDVGKAPQQVPLVKGVRREVMYQQIEHAFESALRAAAAVEVPAGQDAADADVLRRMAFERRRAAEAVLKQQLGALGLDVSGLTLPQPNMPADILSLARPLAMEAAGQ